MIGAGLFTADSIASPGAALAMSRDGALHMASFFLAFVSLSIASLVFAMRFAQSRAWGWALYSLASGLTAPALISASMTQPAWAGLIVGGAGLVLFGWLSAVALKLLSDEPAGALPD